MTSEDRGALHRSIKNGMVDVMRERLVNTDCGAIPDAWYDNEVGKEWKGTEVVMDLQEAFAWAEEKIAGLWPEKGK